MYRWRITLSRAGVYQVRLYQPQVVATVNMNSAGVGVVINKTGDSMCEVLHAAHCANKLVVVLEHERTEPFRHAFAWCEDCSISKWTR